MVDVIPYKRKKDPEPLLAGWLTQRLGWPSCRWGSGRASRFSPPGGACRPLVPALSGFSGGALSAVSFRLPGLWLGAGGPSRSHPYFRLGFQLGVCSRRAPWPGSALPVFRAGVGSLVLSSVLAPRGCAFSVRFVLGLGGGVLSRVFGANSDSDSLPQMECERQSPQELRDENPCNLTRAQGETLGVLRFCA